MDVKGIIDDVGTIIEFINKCPLIYSEYFLKSIAELENNENHRTKKYPISRFHKMEGTGKYQIFRFDIDKESGWRCYAQFGKDQRLHICGISGKKYHDDPMKFVVTHKEHFEK